MGLLAVLLIVAGLPAPAHGQPERAPLEEQAVTITAEPIPAFDRGNPSRTRFGSLEWRGGVILKSSLPQFGGLSGLTVAPDGRRMLAVADEGSWLVGEITYDGMAPTGITAARMGAIRALSAKALDKKRNNDAEGVWLIEGTLDKGVVLVAFERNHRVGRFPVSRQGLGPPLAYLSLPPEIKRMSANRGLESVCVLASGTGKGTVITLSERYPSADGSHVGWMQTARGWTTLAIRDIDGFDLTDCAGLADGSLLVLERRFRWLEGVQARLRRFSPTELASGQTIEGEVLLAADRTLEIDNMEGLAVHKGARGETVLTLLSDDNFNTLLQRTLLLQFTLVDTARTARKP